MENRSQLTLNTSQQAGAAAPPDVKPSTSRALGLRELGFVGFGALMVSMTQTLLIPVLSTLPRDLRTSASNVQWLLTSTLLVAAVSVPVMGRLGDMFGKKRILVFAMGALVVGSLLAALTSSIALLIVARAIQGMSGAAVPLGISLLSALMPRERAGSAIGLISSMLGVGGALGLPLSGLLVEHYNFHILFWIPFVCGLIAMAGIFFFVPESPSRSGGRIDFIGSTVLAAAMVLLLLPLAESSSWGWGSARVLVMLAAALVLFVLLGWYELHSRNPLIDMHSLSRRPLVLTNLASVLFGFALFASLLGTASYVSAPVASGYGFGSSLLVGGLALLPSGLCMLIFAPVAARLVASRGGGQTLALGAAIVAIGWVLRITVTGSLWEIIVGTTIIGVGTGIGYASMPALINAHSPIDELGAANGLNSLFRSVGSSLASAIGGSVLIATTISVGGFSLPSLAAYRMLFALCAGAAVLAAIAALAIPQPAEARSPLK